MRRARTKTKLTVLRCLHELAADDSLSAPVIGESIQIGARPLQKALSELTEGDVIEAVSPSESGHPTTTYRLTPAGRSIAVVVEEGFEIPRIRGWILGLILPPIIRFRRRWKSGAA